MNEWDEFDGFFRKMMQPFKELEEVTNANGILSKTQTFGPYYYGYSVTVGSDGKPVVEEYGNVRPGLAPADETREPLVDVILDDKEKLLKVVAEMPGVEKNEIKIEVVGRSILLDAEHGERKYHTKIPIKQKVDENSAKASYANGILEVRFKLKEDERPQGKKVEVE